MRVKSSGIFRVLLALFSQKSRQKLILKMREFILGFDPKKADPYSLWLKNNPIKNREMCAGNLVSFSVLIDGRAQESELIRKTIGSILKQPDFHANVSVLLEDEGKGVDSDTRIRCFTQVKSWISELPATGFSAILNAGDELMDDFDLKIFLGWETETADVIYCDHIRYDEDQKKLLCHFKPEFSFYTLSSRNYIGRSFVVSNATLKKNSHGINGFFSHHAFLLKLGASNALFRHVSGLYFKEYNFNTNDGRNQDEVIASLKQVYPNSNIKSFGPNLEYFDICPETVVNPKVSVIIPTRNSTDICETCLKSIFGKTTYNNFEVIILDNGSTENSFFKMVEKWALLEPEKFRTVRDETEFNFSRLMNLGAKASRGELLLLLNNDTEVISPDWMNRMVAYCMLPDVGAVGAKLLYPNNTVQFAGAILGLGDAATHCFVGSSSDDIGYWGSLVCLTEYSILTAACMMVSKEIFWQAGGFDENLAVEFNDFDFCLKLKSMAKHQLFIPQVQLYHHESISRGHPRENPKTYKRYLAELQSFRKRWAELIENDPAYNTYLSRVFDDFRLG